MENKSSILVVDDEYGVLQSFKMVLGSDHNVYLAETGEKAHKIFSETSIDLILLDIMLPDYNGIDLLKKFKEIDPETEVIMVTAVKEVKTAVDAMKFGAYDYIVKPFVVEDIINVVNRSLEKHHLQRKVTYLKDELERFQPFEKIVGNDKKMKEIFELISTISESDGAVLIQGESGTGKELVARAIHKLGTRKEQPFVVINCAAIPETLMESEIFGHNKGAFTGASSIKVGKLEIANNGVVFLDDVDTLDIAMQAKLLRVIQEKEFERLGSTKLIKIDVRFIAASNKNLKRLAETGQFREDLFYRLNVFPIELPPLRERRRDIPLLLNHFLYLYSKHNGKPLKKFSQSAEKVLTDHYDWPGNVRELQNLVERLATITKGNVIFPKSISNFSIAKNEVRDMPLKEAVDIFEKEFINDALKKVRGCRKEAARILGIHRNTLQKKLTEQM
ncbi:MAG: sigma-54-dependent Fis family transcriptional regulator [Deltaproteobacteria bacterium]|nr:sigma-54-dependent Fis family transcriptional regulator [Deltaproteobacteria bacterium]